MRTFVNTCAQGDVYARRIDRLPANAVKVEPVRGQVIVTHSESGHHHVMDAGAVTMYRLPNSIMDCLLVVDQPTALRHLRPHDTHEPILFAPGAYHARRQREHTPQGWRRVED